jgi:hypothetical protein
VRMKWKEHVGRAESMKNAYRILVGKSERKIPLWWPGIVGTLIIKCVLK